MTAPDAPGGSTAPGPLISARDRFFRIFARYHTRLLVRTRGRPSWTGPRLRFLVLETVGRRSGQVRHVALLYMPHEGDFVVVASNYGQERPPAWWINLSSTSEGVVHVSGRSVPVRSRVLVGEERRAILPRVQAYNGLWRGYVQTLRRELPVVRLERTTPGTGLTNPPSPPG